MEQTNEKTTGRTEKKKSGGKSWADHALDGGLTLLSGLLLGIGSAAGSRIVNSAFAEPATGKSEAEGHTVVPLRKVGSA
ncbi:hypothetical protein WDW37_19520 [Bdellovibrionota bacterium FG-1]